MLHRYLTSNECSYKLPADIDEYLLYTDSHLFEHLRLQDSEWSRRISKRKPYRVLLEIHHTGHTERTDSVLGTLNEANIPNILASSTARLSKYHNTAGEDKFLQIYVKDQYDHQTEPFPIEQVTDVFESYEGTRCIDRIYVPPEKYSEAKNLFPKISTPNEV